MHPLFPLPAGQHPGVLLIKVDAGGLAVAELAQPFMDPVNAHLEGDLIEKVSADSSMALVTLSMPWPVFSQSR